MEKIRNEIDLYDLLRALKEGVETLFPSSVWVRAEISSMQARANGHCYMELCQSDDRGVIAKARAAIWRSTYSRLAPAFQEATGSPLRAGIKIRACVRVSYSEQYGLTLIIDMIEPEYTLGEAQMRRLQTIKRLEDEGLMAMQKELALPILPYRLAVISARDAAGYGDFCKQLEENEYGFRFDLTLFEASMQGETSPSSVADALARVEEASATQQFDAVLIMRGGGSALDLACFDEWEMCKAIALCPLPVISAVGHDRDVHVVDHVSCMSVKTPTALAAMLIDMFAAEDESISAIANRLKLAFVSRMSLMDRDIDSIQARLSASLSSYFERQLSRLDRIWTAVSASDPRLVLERGFVMACDEAGVVRKSVNDFAIGGKASVQFADGVLDCEIKNIEYGRKV